MHWYLDEQVVLVQKLFIQYCNDRRLKLQLNIAMLRVQDALANPNDPANGQPQQFLSSYTPDEIRRLYFYARQQTEDLRKLMHKRLKVAPRSAEDTNEALLELRMWLINTYEFSKQAARHLLTVCEDEHEPETEESPDIAGLAARPNMGDLAAMLADINYPLAQRPAILQAAAVNPEKHQAWLKHCFNVKKVTRSVDPDDDDSSSNSESEEKPEEESKRPGTVGTRSSKSIGGQGKAAAASAMDLVARFAALGDTAPVVSASVRADRESSQAAARTGHTLPVRQKDGVQAERQREQQRAQEVTRRASLAPAMQSVSTVSAGSVRRSTDQPMQPPTRGHYISTPYDDSIRQWTAASHVNAVQRQAMLHRLNQMRQDHIAKARQTGEANEHGHKDSDEDSEAGSSDGEGDSGDDE